MIAIFSWQWSGSESRTESSEGHYKLARVMPNIFVGMWLILIMADIVAVARSESFWASFVVAFFVPFLCMGSIVWGLRYLAYRYVSYARITPEGLAVTRGASTTVHPWATIGDIHTVPFVQPALWAVKFRDGSPTAAFFTKGTSTMIFGVVKAKSKFVDEIQRLAGETGAQAE